MKRGHSGQKQSLSQKILTNVVWNFAGNGFVLVITLFATPFIVRSLDINLYGVYSLVGVVIGYLSFMQFGLATASVKYISQHLAEQDDDGVRAVFWTCLFTYIGIGLAGMAIITFLARPFVDYLFKIPPQYRDMAILAFRLGAVGFLVSTVLGPVSGVIQAVGRFDVLNRIGVVMGTLQVILTVGLLKLGLSLAAIILSNIIVQAGGLIAYWVAAMRLVPCLARPLVRRGALQRLFKFGGFVTVSSAVSPILTNIEKIFLSAIYSVASLTYYSIPYALIAKLSIMPAVLSSVIFPAYSSLEASGETEMNKDLNFRSTLYLSFLYAFFALFFVVFGGSFLSVWMGGDFAEKSSRILAILAVAGLINATALPSFTALQGWGKPYIPAAFHVIELVVYIPVSYFCIQRFGGVGAALAWFMRVSLDTFLLHSAVTRIFRVSIWHWYGRLLYRAAPPVATAAALFLALRSRGLLFTDPLNIGGLLAIAVCYAVMVWKWGLDSFARENVLIFMKRSHR